jgi:tRNA(Ile)-lysidine synthase TilS/MesJ
VAVSGGVDSMILCYMLNKNVKENSRFDNNNNKVLAFIIDHKLRKDSTAESLKVSNVLSEIGIFF